MRGVGVVVLDFNQATLTSRCVESLVRSTRPPDHLVIVDNGNGEPYSTDQEATKVVPTTVLRPGRNLGCAGGRNLGVNFIVGNTDIHTIVVLDNDAVVERDTLHRLASRSPADGEVVAPLIRDFHSGAVWSSGGRVTADGTIEQLDTVLDGRDGEITVDWSPGACLAFNRATWSSVGPFDTALDFLFEDIEWCARVRGSNGRVVVRPELIVLHEPHQSLGGEWSPTRVRYWARNSTIHRAVVARAGVASLAQWVGNEILLSVRDVAAGKPKWSTARLLGLGQGLVEIARREMQARGTRQDA